MTLDPQTLFPDRKKNEAALLLAGLKLMNENGVDRISVGQIVGATQYTRPTFYSYFEGVNGLLAAIWLDLADSWFARICDPAEDLGSWSKDDKTINRVLIEILAVAHRIPEVLEVVEPVVSKRWSSVAAAGSYHEEKISWLVSERIGVELTLPVDARASEARFIEAAIRSMPAEPIVPYNQVKKTEQPPLASLELKGVADNEALLEAAIDVIARSGVPNASMSRIGRKAQVTTGAIYPKFSSIDELIDSSFEHAVRSVVNQNFASVEGSEFKPEDFGAFVIAGLDKPRETWRNFRVEIHLEARHRKSLAKRMAKNLDENNRQLGEKLSNYAFPNLLQGPVPYLMQAVGMGFNIMQNAGIAVAKIDHPHFTRELVALLEMGQKG